MDLPAAQGSAIVLGLDWLCLVKGKLGYIFVCFIPLSLWNETGKPCSGNIPSLQWLQIWNKINRCSCVSGHTHSSITLTKKARKGSRG